MLPKIFIKPVELNIDGKHITFNSIDDFEYAMASRVNIPMDRITDAINASPGELELESNAVVVGIEQISELIDQASASGEVTQNLKAINPVIFSSDNGWRDLFFALKKDYSAESSTYKLIAMKAYLQYLTNRQQLIDCLKQQQGQSNEPASFRTGELEYEENFDSRPLAEELGMTTLQKGEPVIMDVNEGDEIALLLASYRCKLVIRNGIRFIDNNNVEYPLRIGDNKVGRGSECKIRFVDTMQRISRLHLIITIHDKTRLELSDMSTYGTHYLKK